MRPRKKTLKKVGGMVFCGSLFMGMAAGFLFGHVPLGLFTGLGLGFMANAAIILLADQAEEDYEVYED